MAITFTELLKQINARAAAQVVAQGVTGLAKGLGIEGVAFETSATSMNWLLAKARETRRITQQEARYAGVTSYEPRLLMAEALGIVKDKSKDKKKGKEEKEPEVKPATASINQALRVGDLQMYIYNPKTKDKLPYYDTFPLVFPFELKDDGWLGLNLHYLPPTHRALLMDALYGTINNFNLDSTTRLLLSYETLKGASKFKAFKPCIKRYLTNHVTSLRLTVHPSQWEQVLTLPLARFVKADQLRVWNESLNKILQDRSKY